MPDYQFVGDTPQAPLGEALWQPRETRPVDAAQAAELDKNVNWREVPQDAPTPAPAPLPADPAPVPADPAPLPTPEEPAPPAPLGG